MVDDNNDDESVGAELAKIKKVNILVITKLQFHKLFCLGDADIPFKFIHHNS